MSINFNNDKTIVSVSTPIGSGGISIVRMSGKEAINIADKLFFSKNKKSPSMFEDRKLYLGNFVGNIINENCLCVVFIAPNSFTGENIVEFQCHGGVKIAEQIVSECIKNGAVLSKRGEFSMRAFLNGKITLSEAEGMMDIINAESEAELKAGYSLANGKLSKIAEEIQDNIVDMMSDIEVSFDYPEHDIEYKTKKDVKERLKSINIQLEQLLKTSKTGSIIKSGINVIIIGKPNVGKSSLLNNLIGKEKAIVTNIPGTTRDIVEDSFEIKGIKVNIIDTAGIHETEDLVEKIGVEKSKELIKQADIVLFIVDSSSNLDEKDNKILKLLNGTKHIIIANKSDLGKKYINNDAVYVSAITGKGVEELKDKIYSMVIDENIISSSVLLTNERHVDAINRANEAVLSAIKNIDNQTLDVISIDIMEAFTALGEITGTTSSEEIIDSIFSKFCLGK